MKRQPDQTVTTDHLQFIQSIISRMADNSKSTKYLALGLTVIVTLISKGVAGSVAVGMVYLFALCCLWGQDAQYLRLERAYRKLYSEVVDGLNAKPFTLDPTPYLGRVGSAIQVAWSWSVGCYYLPLAILVSIIHFLVKV